MKLQEEGGAQEQPQNRANSRGMLDEDGKPKRQFLKRKT